MGTTAVKRPDITNEKELDREIVRLSKQHPKKYITYSIMWCKVTVYLHDHKPQSLTFDAEYTYRQRGGFFKNGEIVKPSNTFVNRFEFCPYLG